MRKFAMAILCFSFVAIAATCLQAGNEKISTDQVKIAVQKDGVWATLPSKNGSSVAFFEQGGVPAVAIWGNPRKDTSPAVVISVQDGNPIMQVAKNGKVVMVDLYDLAVKMGSTK